MENLLIHKNLDTSFVNLPALIKHLRCRKFTGSVRVELPEYEADITLTADEPPRAREHDQRANRISEGEEALQRLLIRARAPGGTINVYEKNAESAVTNEESAAVIERKIVAETVGVNGNHRNGNNGHGEIASPNGNSRMPQFGLPDIEQNILKRAAEPPLPFDLSNKYEGKARLFDLSPADWQMLLNLTAELLGTVETTLAESNLEFATAFEKARAEISGDYPFLNAAAGVFNYKNGKIIVREQINAKLFAASINEALRRILDKLGRNPKFLNIYLTTVQNIILLIEKRRPLYEKFFITPQLARIIGV